MPAMWKTCFAVALCILPTACSGARAKRVAALPPTADPNDLIDLSAESNPSPSPAAPSDVLVLGGLGSRSLYAYGVLSGWADSGTMPEFQIVTGVGGGAYAAMAVFAGREYLSDLSRIFLAFDQRKILHGDAWDAKRFPHPLGAGTASVATTDKIRAQTRTVLTAEYFAKVAAEHAKGRRLYIGTTNLDTERFVAWDMGAIASRGTAESRRLYEDIVVASTAVPPLLDPSRIAVRIDGRPCDEMHAEGGLTRALYWPDGLAGARVHVVTGNKPFNDPDVTQAKLLDVTLRSMKTMLLAIHRGDLARLADTCRAQGAPLRVAAIPTEYDPPLFQTDVFDPAKTAKLYRDGYTRGWDGRAWSNGLPGSADPPPRRGTDFTLRVP